MTNRGPRTRPFADTRDYWSIMTLYERFEHIVAVALSLIIAIVIVIALYQLGRRTLPLVLGGVMDPLDHEVFQNLFGAMMTVLIAMEFKHSIIRVAARRGSIIRVKTVVLIAILALSRKFVILDNTVTSAATIAALASAVLVLGVVYCLLPGREDPQAPVAPPE